MFTLYERRLEDFYFNWICTGKTLVKFCTDYEVSFCFINLQEDKQTNFSD